MYLSQHDWHSGMLAMLIIALTVAGIEWSVRKGLFNKNFGRKILHFTAISTCGYAIDVFEDRRILGYIFLFFFFLLLWVVKKGWMQVNENRTYGIAFFPLAFGLLLLVPVFPVTVVVFSVLTLAICDAAAGLTGEFYGKTKIPFLFEIKSWAGFFAFYVSCFFLSLFYFRLFSGTGILYCIIIALLPALTELFSYKGSDNLSVPLITALWTFLVLQLNTDQLYILSLVGISLFLPAYFAIQRKWLTTSGATAAVWLGLLLYLTAGYAGFVAPASFLVIGSLLSKLNEHPGEKNGRNGMQVFANGMIGLVCFIIFNISKDPLFLAAALLSFCTSMSDSVSSEMGMYLKGVTIDIYTLKRTTPGLSGGISLAGTLFGLGGAVLSAALSVWVFHLNIFLFYWITLGGFAGMMLDSVIGSLFQRKYSNEMGLIYDEPGPGLTLVKGFNRCNNDLVNILSNLLTTLLFILIHPL